MSYENGVTGMGMASREADGEEESRNWEMEFRNRLGRHFLRCFGSAHARSNEQALFDAIMADMEVYGILKAREGWEGGGKLGYKYGCDRTVGPNYDWKLDARSMKSLPKRTRHVLREEPMPRLEGLEPYSLLYRWNGGRLESRIRGEWHPHNPRCDDPDLMRHALDLHDNPYRTEEVEADEHDPWPEMPS